ncbi:MAG: hypothetical protein LBP75_11805 [Planctomycetota bacterium]|jgi:hypothetical protein|nr:hypothetical protein [Planctomycetota bacterium]
MQKFPLPLQGGFSGNANPARRKIDTADFPLGWAVTLCRFAANLLISTAIRNSESPLPFASLDIVNFNY